MGGVSVGVPPCLTSGIRQYLKAGLLDEMQIHLIPILLGNGIRLFEDLDPEGIESRRTSTIETPGATQSRFEVVK
jgi:dihydrofolate reductase